MKNMNTKLLAAANLLVVIILTACGNANTCPSGQQSVNNQCVAMNGYNGYTYNQGQTAMNGNSCQIGQLYSPTYGCLQANVNGCTGGTGWSTQANQCVAGTPVTTQYNQQYGYQNGYQYGNIGYNYGYNTGYYNPTLGYNGYNTGSQCGAGFVFTNMYGCLQQGGCPYGMGMGPFGCTY